MKLSKIMHVIAVLTGFLWIGILVAAGIAGQNSLVFGFSREHLLFCSIIVFLIAIYLQIATIHHMMLEKEGKII